MEKWKIGVIAVLLLGLIGYGYVASGGGSGNVTPTPGPSPTPAPAKYVGGVIGGPTLPEWTNVKQWMNTPKPIALSSLKGSVSLVEVFRIECPHCQEAAVPMEHLFERYKARGLKMAALESPADRTKASTSPEADWSQVEKFANERGIKYPVGFDTQSDWFQGKIKGDFYPTILVFDKTGKAVYEATGHDNTKFMTLIANLERLLPGKGDIKQRSQDAAKWLSGVLSEQPGMSDQAPPDADMMKELAQDIETLMSGKKLEDRTPAEAPTPQPAG